MESDAHNHVLANPPFIKTMDESSINSNDNLTNLTPSNLPKTDSPVPTKSRSSSSPHPSSTGSSSPPRHTNTHTSANTTPQLYTAIPPSPSVSSSVSIPPTDAAMGLLILSENSLAVPIDPSCSSTAGGSVVDQQEWSEQQKHRSSFVEDKLPISITPHHNTPNAADGNAIGLSSINESNSPPKLIPFSTAHLSTHPGLLVEPPMDSPIDPSIDPQPVDTAVEPTDEALPLKPPQTHPNGLLNGYPNGYSASSASSTTSSSSSSSESTSYTHHRLGGSTVSVLTNPSSCGEMSTNHPPPLHKNHSHHSNSKPGIKHMESVSDPTVIEQVSQAEMQRNRRSRREEVVSPLNRKAQSNPDPIIPYLGSSHSTPAMQLLVVDNKGRGTKSRSPMAYQSASASPTIPPHHTHTHSRSSSNSASPDNNIARDSETEATPEAPSHSQQHATTPEKNSSSREEKSSPPPASHALRFQRQHGNYKHIRGIGGGGVHPLVHIAQGGSFSSSDLHRHANIYMGGHSGHTAAHLDPNAAAGAYANSLLPPKGNSAARHGDSSKKSHIIESKDDSVVTKNKSDVGMKGTAGRSEMDLRAAGKHGTSVGGTHANGNGSMAVASKIAMKKHQTVPSIKAPVAEWRWFVPINNILEDPERGHKKYDCFKKIGSGVFARVYKTKRKSPKRRVAVKVFMRSNVQAEISFANELKILQKSLHPNTIHLYDSWVDAKYFYLEMELCSGGDLWSYMVNTDRATEQQARTVCKQLLDVLSWMHKENFVHRDLKPENIVLLTHGDLNHIRVIDFGEAIEVKEKTIYASSVGTLCYFAPERWSTPTGEELMKSDIWSVGLIVWELIAGQRYYSKVPMKDLQKQIRKAELHIPDYMKITSECRDFLFKMLEKDPAKRVSAEEAFRHPWIWEKSMNVNSVLTPRGFRRQRSHSEPHNDPSMMVDPSMLQQQYYQGPIRANHNYRGPPPQQQQPYYSYPQQQPYISGGSVNSTPMPQSAYAYPPPARMAGVNVSSPPLTHLAYRHTPDTHSSADDEKTSPLMMPSGIAGEVKKQLHPSVSQQANVHSKRRSSLRQYKVRDVPDAEYHLQHRLSVSASSPNAHISSTGNVVSPPPEANATNQGHKRSSSHPRYGVTPLPEDRDGADPLSTASSDGGDDPIRPVDEPYIDDDSKRENSTSVSGSSSIGGVTLRHRRSNSLSFGQRLFQSPSTGGSPLIKPNQQNATPIILPLSAIKSSDQLNDGHRNSGDTNILLQQQNNNPVVSNNSSNGSVHSLSVCSAPPLRLGSTALPEGVSSTAVWGGNGGPGGSKSVNLTTLTPTGAANSSPGRGTTGSGGSTPNWTSRRDRDVAQRILSHSLSGGMRGGRLPSNSASYSSAPSTRYTASSVNNSFIESLDRPDRERIP